MGDQTLTSSTLSEKVGHYQTEMQTNKTKSQKRQPIHDSCPEEYKAARAELDKKHMVRVKESEKERLGKKFGYDKFGRVNAHFADLCELEMLGGGESVYTGFVNEYISKSDNYINNHRQGEQTDIEAKLDQIHFLPPADSIDLSQEEGEELRQVIELLSPSHNKSQHEATNTGFTYK